MKKHTPWSKIQQKLTSVELLNWHLLTLIHLLSCCLDPSNEKNSTAVESREGDGGEGGAAELSSQAVVGGILDELIDRAVPGN